MKTKPLFKSTVMLNRISGFTLVELMIAMTISVVLIGGVIQTFLGSKQAYRLQESQARMQENARFIFSVLSHDIRQAGYSGCNSRRLTNINNVLNNPDTFYFRFATLVEGYDAQSSVWNPAIAPEINSPLIGNDILVIRGAVANGTRVVLHSPGAAPDPTLTAMPDNNLKQGNIVALTDCTSAVIFQITNDNPAPNDAGEIIYSDAAPAGHVTTGNTTNNLGLKYRDDAELVRLATRVFYIRTGASGLPALYRKTGSTLNDELVEGVEGMQIIYGEDTNGDAAIDRMVPAHQVSDMDNVIAVRISILLQSISDNLSSQPQSYTFNGANMTPTDRRVRRIFTTTITFRNRLA
jgi:type IV pilus assembly protein PilW